MNNTWSEFESIKISPTGKNKWGKDLLSKSIDIYGATGKITVTYTTDAPMVDIRIVDGYDDVTIYKECDLTGITADSGGIINISLGDNTHENSVVISNSTPAIPIKEGDYGTDTIDIVLTAGTNVQTFNIEDFIIGYDDGLATPYAEDDIKLVSLSQTTAGKAKLTIARYFYPEQEINPYCMDLMLYYKKEKVGNITITNY
jgi:hypothetical protein